jgi:hypothetical protein
LFGDDTIIWWPGNLCVISKGIAKVLSAKKIQRSHQQGALLRDMQTACSAIFSSLHV